MRKLLTIIVAALFLNTTLHAQSPCADEANIYAFSFGGTDYEIVKENKNWVDAAACAVEREGHLAEINSQGEQDAIYAKLLTAGITLTNTVAPDGGGASYVWLGGNDIADEGAWFWDGDNDGEGTQFWQGDAGGSSVNDAYTNWGNEPDDWNGQDAVGIALTEWPLGSGYLGSASQWNDVKHTNTLYFIIEKSTTGIKKKDRVRNVMVYPNPAKNKLFFKNYKNSSIAKLQICDMQGKVVFEKEYDNNFDGSLNISDLTQGTYSVNIFYLEGGVASYPVIIN